MRGRLASRRGNEPSRCPRHSSSVELLVELRYVLVYHPTSAGHDVSIVRDERLSGAADTVVLEAAVAERRALITLDHDFLAALDVSELGRELWIVEPGRIRVHQRG